MTKLTGIKKAVGIIKSAKHTVAYLDTITGEVWVNEYSDGNSWTHYHDRNVIGLREWIYRSQEELGEKASWTAILTWAAKAAIANR